MSKVNGFDDLQKKLRAYTAKIEQETKDLVEYHTGEIEIEAIRLAPGGGDRIKVEGGSISQDQISDKRRGNQTPIASAIGYEIVANGYKGVIYVNDTAGDIAAYVEFGTGQSAASYLADKDPEWKSLAQLFYIDGQGTILAQPYLLPAFLKGQLEFLKDMKAMVKRIKL